MDETKESEAIRSALALGGANLAILFYSEPHDCIQVHHTISSTYCLFPTPSSPNHTDSSHPPCLLLPSSRISSRLLETPLLIKHVDVARSVGPLALCHGFADSLPIQHMLIPGTFAYGNISHSTRH